jgi:hypothetical protein
LILAVTGVFALSLGVQSAFASHPEVSLPGSNFEIDTDANLKVDDPSPSIDWANVSEIRKQDKPTGSGDDSFGQGTKESTTVPTVVDGSIPPNKSDLKAFGVYQEGSTTAGFLNLFWSRVQDPSGTTNMDFEFNKNSCPGAGCSGNGITPLRTEGDILVIYDLSQGGTHPTLSIRRWTGTAWGAATDLTAASDATGSINKSAIPAAEADGLGSLSPRTFGEAQLDLAAIFEGATDCTSFGSAYLKSRSSDSFTAALKDFIAPVGISISNCGSVAITKTDNAATPNPLAGATFTAYVDAIPTGGSVGAEDTVSAGTCTTGAAGTCTISNLLAGPYWIVETTTPAGYDTAAPQHATVTASTTPVSLTFVDPLQLGAIKITKVGKDKSCTAVSGTCSAVSERLLNGAVFQLRQSGAVKYSGTTAGSGSSAGVVCIGGVLPGTYNLRESTAPTGYSGAVDSTVVITAGTTCGGTGAEAPLSVKVVDQPLTTITVSTTPQVAGTTESTVQCTPASATGDANPVATPHTTNAVVPGTYICTVVIDP